MAQTQTQAPAPVVENTPAVPANNDVAEAMNSMANQSISTPGEEQAPKLVDIVPDTIQAESAPAVDSAPAVAEQPAPSIPAPLSQEPATTGPSLVVPAAPAAPQQENRILPNLVNEPTSAAPSTPNVPTAPTIPGANEPLISLTTNA